MSDFILLHMWIGVICSLFYLFLVSLCACLQPPTLFLPSFHWHLWVLSSLRFRCSSCSCSVGKASSGSRNGTCLCLTRRKRRSPESWCRQSWLANPRCAASWSGETWRLCTRGGWVLKTRLKSKVLSERSESFSPLTGQFTNPEPKLGFSSGLRKRLNTARRPREEIEHQILLIMSCCCANRRTGRLLVNRGVPQVLNHTELSVVHIHRFLPSTIEWWCISARREDF